MAFVPPYTNKNLNLRSVAKSAMNVHNFYEFHFHYQYNFVTNLLPDLLIVVSFQSVIMHKWKTQQPVSNGKH